MKNGVALLWLIWLLTSCSSKTMQVGELYVPDLLDNKAKVSLSDLFSSITYIPLESTKEIYLNQIDFLIVDENFVLVYDSKGKKLLQFNGEGLFVKEFMKAGKGPGEFFQITALDINKKKEILVLRNGQYLDILKEDGSLINSIDFSAVPQSARWLTNDIILLLYSFPTYLFNDGFEICFMDKDGNILKKSLKKPTSGIERGRAGRLRCGSNGSEFYYWSHQSDTVYTITKNMQVYPKYVLTHDKRHIPVHKYSQTGYQPDLDQRYTVESYHEWGDYIFIFSVYNYHGYRGIINHKLGLRGNVIDDYNQWTEPGLLNTIDGGMSFWPGTNLIDGSIIRALDPIELRESFYHNLNSNLPVNAIKQELLKAELIDSLTLMSNPVLMRVKQ